MIGTWFSEEVKLAVKKGSMVQEKILFGISSSDLTSYLQST